MDPQSQSKINQAISLLQSLSICPSTSSAEPMQLIPNFDEEFTSAVNKGRSLEPPISELAVELMKQIMSKSQTCKKPVGDVEEKLKNKFIHLAKLTEEIERNHKHYFDHAKAVRELLSATFWVFVVILILLENTPEFIIKGAIESADFNALKFQRNKNKDHNEWWQRVGNSMRWLEKYVVKSYPSGLNYNFGGSSNWDNIIEEVTSIKEQVKSVEKPMVKNTQSSTKKPVKEMIGPNMTIAYQLDTQIILGENEVQMKNGIFVECCKNLKLEVQAKFKSLQMNKCESLTLIISSCISGVEIMNCNQIKVIVKQKTPSISVDNCQKVQIVLNESNLNCDIVSAKASELTVTFENDAGNGPTKHLISDQLITKWNPSTKKFETVIYDKFL